MFNARAGLLASVIRMTTAETTASDLPFFPVPMPPVFEQAEPLLDLVSPVLDRLALLVEGSMDAEPGARTPCADFDVTALRDHIVGWLDFFGAALADPQRRTSRPDPTAYRAADDGRVPAEVVRAAAAKIEEAVRGGVLNGEVAVSQSRMSGPGVLGMVLGEYTVHGWDLARATGQLWDPPTASCEAALDFFRGMVAPEYRGGDGGFFAEEVFVPASASAIDRLIGFAGRDTNWT